MGGLEQILDIIRYNSRNRYGSCVRTVLGWITCRASSGESYLRWFIGCYRSNVSQFMSILYANLHSWQVVGVGSRSLTWSVARVMRMKIPGRNTTSLSQVLNDRQNVRRPKKWDKWGMRIWHVLVLGKWVRRPCWLFWVYRASKCPCRLSYHLYVKVVLDTVSVRLLWISDNEMARNEEDLSSTRWLNQSFECRLLGISCITVSL